MAASGAPRLPINRRTLQSQTASFERLAASAKRPVPHCGVSRTTARTPTRTSDAGPHCLARPPVADPVHGASVESVERCGPDGARRADLSRARTMRRPGRSGPRSGRMPRRPTAPRAPWPRAISTTAMCLRKTPMPPGRGLGPRRRHGDRRRDGDLDGREPCHQCRRRGPPHRRRAPRQGHRAGCRGLHGLEALTAGGTGRKPIVVVVAG
jgi:hypothetical protein